MATEAADEAAAASPPAKAEEPKVKTEAELWQELQAGKVKASEDDQELRAPAVDPKEEHKEEPKPEEKPAAMSELDIWASASPEQRAAYQAAQQKARSNSGRISALQRKINALQQHAPDDGKARPKARDAIASLRNDYPDIAEPLDKLAERVDERDAQDDSAREQETADTISELDQLYNAEEALLAERHPNWKEAFPDEASRKELNDWLVNVAPKRLYDAAIRNKDAITDAAGAIEVLDSFKRYRGDKPPAAAAASAAEPPKQPKPQSQPKLDDKRQRQLDATAAPQPGAARTTVSHELPEQGDGEMMWKQLQEEKARKRAGQLRR